VPLPLAGLALDGWLAGWARSLEGEGRVEGVGVWWFVRQQKRGKAGLLRCLRREEEAACASLLFAASAPRYLHRLIVSLAAGSRV